MTGDREPVIAWLRDFRAMVETNLPHARHVAQRLHDAERYARHELDPNVALVGSLIGANAITQTGAEHVRRWAARRQPDVAALFATLAALEAGHAVDAALHHAFQDAPGEGE
jgi:hypothetical protein